MRLSKRQRIREGLSPLYLPYYDALCEALSEQWQPYMGFRDFALQDQLWRQGRLEPGSIVTNAQGGESPHQYGCATDWCLWEKGRPYWPDAHEPIWKEYVSAVKKVGLKAGADFGDTVHNELKIGVSWKRVREYAFEFGMSEVPRFIEENIVVGKK